MFSYILFNYNNIKRPLEKCDKSFLEPLNCYGMPSGHAEIITIVALLLYKNKIISFEIAILLIIIFSLQRIITKKHTILQVIVGSFLGLIYGQIYNSFRYSFIIIILFELYIVNLIIYKVDLIVNKKIPTWVSKEMYPLIIKKKNICKIFKILHVYSNCILSNPLIISWEKLENIMDNIIIQIKQFEINNSIKFDAIIGIKTGGAILSDYISDKLKIKNYKIKLKIDCLNEKTTTSNWIKIFIKKRSNEKYTICEDIIDNISNYNIILIDESIDSGITIKNAYNYLIENKKVKYIYQQTIFINKPDIQYNYIYINNLPFIFPWGYDN
jgi:hypoxanthine phosphoribosyltransferase